MNRRVVITGMGAVTPVGNTVAETWEAIVNGKNGIGFITQFDTSNCKVKIGGEVKNLDVDKYIDPREARRMDRAAIFALIAATEAYADAGLENAAVDRDRFGVFVTSGIGGMQTINEESRKSHEKGPDRVSPFFVPNAIINLIGGLIAIKYKIHGPNLPVVTACSSGTNSIGEAFRYIRDGYLDIAFAGGTEAPINELGVGGFTAMRALNTSNDPDNACMPFDKRRSGFVIAEGAGVLIVEELEHALKRGAPIYAELLGYGTTCDAYHITAPDESAEGIVKAIKLALNDADVNGDVIDHINAHGTSTPYNDRLETLAIKKALGDHAYKVNISSTKSMTGHSLGATGAIETILTVKAITDGICPPTINYREFDPECDLNFTPNAAVRRDIGFAMNINVGFGGQNAVLILKKYRNEE
jgi:3-oxoacyl-[acyl-carrier-protein] synthase II